MKLLLGSQSPRRRALLETLGYNFSVVSIDCDEVYPPSLSINEIPEYLSEHKAHAYVDLKVDEVLLTSDTIVALEDEVLGKPKNEDEAFAMLRKLSGKTHRVLTAITIKTTSEIISSTDVAHVVFNELTDEEIKFYIQNYSPLDKAGAYGIQDWMGMAKIKKIEGSFYTVMGLPTHLVYGILQQFPIEKKA